MDGQINLATTG